MRSSRNQRIVTRPGLRGLIAACALLALGSAVAAAKSEFFIQGAQLTKQADGSWKGPGKLDGVKGTLTLTGKVVLLKQRRHRIRFRWTSGRRLVAGCSFNEVLTRPHGVQLWDGGGQITKTSAQERKYQGVHVSLYGPTRRDDLKQAKISIRASTPRPGLPARNC